MFKTNAMSEMHITKFGAGSIIEASGGEEYFLVIGYEELNTISLVNMKTWRRVGCTIKVEDINFLTRQEAEALCKQTGYQHTFSDYSLYPAGLKFHHERQNFKDHNLT